jgi:hypothetical protein
MSPRGTLVIHGGFASGLYAIQWAIGRHWFVEDLQSVGVVDWHELVENNLYAQEPALWNRPRLLIQSLRPALLADGSLADPGYAERMLEHRIVLGLPTVITIERYGLDEVNLKRGTVRLLEEQRNVVLSRLDKEDRGKGGMF